MEIYGKRRPYANCIDLLWGQKLYQELRLVLVEMNGSQSILTSTSLTLDPLSIIRFYSYRFWIECILQNLSIYFIGKISSDQIRYQRIPSRGRASEATRRHYFRKHFSAF